MSAIKNPNKQVTGPYRATKLWNDAVRSFYNEMPLSRHWRGLKQYENCFTSAEAIDWLHGYLLSNPNFGPTVTREQTLKLLRKFLKSGLIIEARGTKVYAEDLQDNRELFKFGNQSPLKVLRTPGRTPLAPIIVNALSNNGSSPAFKDNKKKKLGLHNDKRSETENTFNEKTENFTSLSKVPLSDKQINKSWQETYFEKLEMLGEQLMVGGDGSAPLLPFSCINASWIRHNMTLLKSKRIFGAEGLTTSDELPSWILSAMNSLVNWPNSADSVCNIPNYPGVEIDIFKVVREFFSDMVIPLIPYELYDSIIRLYIGAEFLDIAHRTPGSSKESNVNNTMDHSMSSLSSYDSVEDLILNISVGGTQLQENIKSNNRELFPVISNIDQGDNIIIGKEGMIETKTPIARLINEGLSSIPNSLRLNKLNNYTNFKESYLYSKEEQPSSSNVSTNTVEGGFSVPNRITVKSLKNKSLMGVRQCGSNEGVGSTSSLFKKGLKTEELDSFCLPPNSCFETAFTSDSPRTRIIPQKTVDTIHFRHCSQTFRPKSIAVSSLVSMINGSSCADLDKQCVSGFNKSVSASTYLDRSLSEGNLANAGRENPCLSNSHLSGLEGELKSKLNLKKSFNTKSILAAKVRDSIKRKKGNDSKHKHRKNNSSNDSKSSNYSNEENSFEKSSTSSNCSNSADLLNRMRTKSGGYENLALSVRSFSPDTASTRSSSSDLSNFKNKSGGYINIGAVHSNGNLNCLENVQKFYSKSSRTYAKLSGYNTISAHSRRYSPAYDFSSSSTPQPIINRSKSVTPDGCLSHSLASNLSNSIYHSALSTLNQTSLSRTSIHSRTPSDFDQKYICSPPVLPKRKPAVQMNSSEFDSFRMSIENENTNDRSYENMKSLSSSANELSDVWVDRTPFGTVPPFIRGGLWRHYHSSPSKRLMGPHNRFHRTYGSRVCVPGLLTKVGKEVCVEAFQLILLNVEPTRRRKLYLLLKMMNKVSSNEKLQIDGLNPNRALMVKTFTRSVLLSSKEKDYDEMLSTRIVTLLMDNYSSIFSPPQNLAVVVHRRINENMSRTESAIYSQTCTHHPITYCRQITPEAYEKQKFTGSQQFLSELLDQILENPKLNDKEKRKKLKEFRVHYPEIYDHKFPPGKENEEVVPEKKRKLKGFKKFASIRSLARHKSFRI